MSWPKRNSKRGFTLIELLVTISIFVILTGVVIFNESKFNSTILLTNLGYDVALTIRQAQTYGINIKEFNDEGFLPYGVHFDKSDDAKKSFILFADVRYDPIDRIAYPYGFDDLLDLSECQVDLGCVSRYNIQRGNYISDLWVDDEPVDSLDIIFQRPNPDAIIISNGDISGTLGGKAEIFLISSDGTGSTTISVQSNGLIEVLK
jgi:prepilin-type N-terminal cleavage/methylation domain-containing protein